MTMPETISLGCEFVLPRPGPARVAFGTLQFHFEEKATADWSGFSRWPEVG
jgi:hypothetical protein